MTKLTARELTQNDNNARIADRIKAVLAGVFDEVTGLQARRTQSRHGIVLDVEVQGTLDGECEALSFTVTHPDQVCLSTVVRDDFTGSACWGKVFSDEFELHTRKAFTPGNESGWLDQDGNGIF